MKVTSALGACLRQATRDTHHSLDSHPVLRPLVSPGLTSEDYLQALLALYSAQCRLEEAIARGLYHLQLDYPLQPRAPALADDLTSMGQSLPTIDKTPMLTVCQPGQLIGLLYVLEGARLGSRVIARNVHRSLGDRVPSGYFSIAEEAENWNAFWQFAELHCPDAEQPAAMTAADAAFQLFLSGLDQYRVAVCPGCA